MSLYGKNSCRSAEEFYVGNDMFDPHFAVRYGVARLQRTSIEWIVIRRATRKNAGMTHPPRKTRSLAQLA
jgi:hypothetical protein